MLDHYFEIKAIPQEELQQSTVISLAMQDLHSLLSRFDGKIGLSFPDYNKQILNIGGRIRCFSSSNNLESLRLNLLGKELVNYTLISDISPIPKKITAYYVYGRVQNKGASDLRRAQKRMKNSGKNDEEINKILNLKTTKQKSISLPHVHIKSSSTGQDFLLMIKKEQKKEKSEGIFNNYGLSKTATVPDF